METNGRAMVDVNRLINKFTGMAERGALLTGEKATQHDLLMQITGTILHVYEDSSKKNPEGNNMPLFRKKRVFISQPMRGINDEFVLEERSKIKEAVEKKLGEEVELIDQFHKEDVPDTAGPCWYLGDSIMEMDKADIFVMANTGSHSFYDARGCLIEASVAMIYGKKILNFTSKKTDS